MVLVIHEMPGEARLAVLAEVGRLARRVVCVDFHAPMPLNFAGLRNCLIEAAAGAEHFRAFRSFQRDGGMAEVARSAGLDFEPVRLLDAGTMAVGVVRRRGWEGRLPSSARRVVGPAALVRASRDGLGRGRAGR